MSHRVTDLEFLYEPFYVSLADTPMYDERFIGYGYTRNTQVMKNNSRFLFAIIKLVHWEKINVL